LSRLSLPNALKVVLVVVFCPFIALLVLLIGIGAKSKKIIIEGAICSLVFFVALGFHSDIAAFAGLGTMIFSAVRAYMLRDFWLPKRSEKATVESRLNTPSLTGAAPVQELHPASQSFNSVKNSLTSAVAMISAEAKLNKHRLPGNTYVTILETCQLLDSVVDAETDHPISDARFEYELSAIIKEYIPSVLQGYLAIPPSLVQEQQPNGKTPNQELTEQLGLLQAQAENLHAVRHRRSSDDLTTTGNFLRERFGHHLQNGFDFGIK